MTNAAYQLIYLRQDVYQHDLPSSNETNGTKGVQPQTEQMDH